MTNTHYLPGDRVRYKAGNADHIHHMLGALGTITPHPKGLDCGYPTVKFDNLEYIHDLYMIENIEPAEIAVGAWVRVVDMPHIAPWKVFGTTNGHAYVKNGPPWTFEQLRVVAEPETPKSSINIGGMKFEIMEDGTKRASLDAGVFVIGDSGEPNTLKQAQRLAETLDRKHFGDNLKVPTHLTDCLNVIDHMTAHMVRDTTTLTQDAINRLAEFIMSEIPGEPSQSEGAVDTAIRIMREQRAAIQTAARRLAKWVKDAPAGYRTDESRAWLAANAPELVTPVFKRGDLVTWGAGGVHGRIVKMPVQTNDPHEVIITVGSEVQLSKFLNISNGQNMRFSPLK